MNPWAPIILGVVLLLLALVLLLGSGAVITVDRDEKSGKTEDPPVWHPPRN